MSIVSTIPEEVANSRTILKTFFWVPCPQRRGRETPCVITHQRSGHIVQRTALSLKQVLTQRYIFTIKKA